MKIFYFLAKKILIFRTPASADEIRKKQTLMHPGKSGKELTDEYFVKKTGLILAILITGVFISIIAYILARNSSTEITSRKLTRNGYGQGDRQVDLDIYADGEKIQQEGITVSEKQYTSDEIEIIFEKIGSEIKEKILGQNESLDHIDHDLRLITKTDDYPVKIEWQISDYDILDGSGKISENYENESGTAVKLTAILSYKDFRGEYEFYANVFPVKKDPAVRFSQMLRKSITEYSFKTISDDNQQLPETVDGKNMEYRESIPKTPFYIMIMVVIAAFVIHFGRDRELDREVQKREREMQLCYPEIVSKLVLLIGAGMTIRGSFEKIVLDYRKKNGPKKFAYEEMIMTVNRMKSGISEYDAYADFGKRCAVKRYTKLGALLSQNVKKGSTGLLAVLENDAREAFEDRKAMARRLGEEAGTKLLGPMGLMLMVVMIVVIVPAFMSFGF